MEVLWSVSFLGMAIATVAIASFRPMLKRYGVVDEPNSRSSHVQPTLRGGGVGIVLSVATGGVWLAGLFPSEAFPILVVTLGATMAGVVGLIEDIRGLAVPLRAGTQLAIGLAIAVPLAVAEGQHWMLGIVGGLAIMAYVNIANFMDGINGISGLHGAIVGAAYAGIAIGANQDGLAAFGLLVAGAFTAFLPWNLTRPGLFLGDVGSYFLGAVLAALGIGLIFVGVSPIAVAMPLSIYAADVFSTLARRVTRGEPVLRPHRTHAYQRLTDTRLGHVAVSGIVSLFTAVAGAIGVLLSNGLLPDGVGVVCVMALCVVYLALPRMRGSRLASAPSYALEPCDEPPAKREDPAYAPEVWAVLGASGFVGSAVVELLLEQGHEVRTFRAPRVTLDPTISAPEDIFATAREHEMLGFLAEKFRGVDVVINAAGMASPDSAGDENLYGANSLLPSMVRVAAGLAGVHRVIHLSSAAVQGRRPVLDESIVAAPFSPYSLSKALGERAFLAEVGGADAVVVRATSVQGPGRRTTAALQRVAASGISSVAGDGAQPTVVSSIDGLAEFVYDVSKRRTGVRAIMLQPWEGLSAVEVLETAGGRHPMRLPSWLCSWMLVAVRAVGRIVPEIAGAGRRLELMWMGQAQVVVPDDPYVVRTQPRLRAILASSIEESL